MISARLVAITNPFLSNIPDADSLIAYCARVSNPANQDNHETANKLLSYCARHGHWSVFEMANAVVEVEAPRDISRQLLRHRSMHFQELSQRYSADVHFIDRELRLQCPHNRQASHPCGSADYHLDWQHDLDELAQHVTRLQKKWLERGAAKETVRVIYPEGLTMSRLYANATVRDWWHYCRVRTAEGTQPEHQDLAIKIESVLADALPDVWRGLRESVA